MRMGYVQNPSGEGHAAPMQHVLMGLFVGFLSR